MKYPKALSLDFGVRVAVWAILIGVGFYFIQSGSTSLVIVGVLLNGMMFAHGVELQHQCLHGSGFHSKFANSMTGHLLGAPMLVSFTGYQKAHLWHHRFLGTDRDQEFFDYDRGQTPSPWQLIQYTFAWRRFRKLGWKFALAVGAGILTALLGNSLLLLAWILPLIAIAEPVHNLVELPEHLGCDTRSRDVFRNTRSITSNAFMTWFTNGNNLHVEHHKFPGVPLQFLTEIHAKTATSIVHLDRTYIDFFRKCLIERRLS